MQETLATTTTSRRSARDAVADQQWNAQFGYQAGRDIVGDLNTDRAFDYQQSRDRISDQRYEQEYQDTQAAQARAEQAQRQSMLISLVQSGYTPTAADLEWAGMSAGQLQSLMGLGGFIRQQASKYY